MSTSSSNWTIFSAWASGLIQAFIKFFIAGNGGHPSARSNTHTQSSENRNKSQHQSPHNHHNNNGLSSGASTGQMMGQFQEHDSIKLSAQKPQTIEERVLYGAKAFDGIRRNVIEDVQNAFDSDWTRSTLDSDRSRRKDFTSDGEVDIFKTRKPLLLDQLEDFTVIDETERSAFQAMSEKTGLSQVQLSSFLDGYVRPVFRVEALKMDIEAFYNSKPGESLVIYDELVELPITPRDFGQPLSILSSLSKPPDRTVSHSDPGVASSRCLESSPVGMRGVK